MGWSAHFVTIHLLFCQECGRELLDEPELGLLEGPAHVVELAKVGDVEDQGVKLSIVNSRVVRKGFRVVQSSQGVIFPS